MFYKLKNLIIKFAFGFIYLLLCKGVAAETLRWTDAIQLIDQNGHAQIPADYTAIGDYAFKNTSLRTISIPSTISSIGEGAFQNSLLTSVSIPNTVSIIENSTFSGTPLTEIFIPDTVTSIGGSAFLGTDLVSINLPQNLLTIEGYAFSNSNISHISIPNSVISIESYAFNGTPLREIEIGNSLETIGSYAFVGTKLESLKIPDSVTSIGNWSFRDTPIETLEIGVGLASGAVGVGAFYGVCNTLETIILNNPSGMGTNSNHMLDNSWINALGSSRRIYAGLKFYTEHSYSSGFSSCPNLKLIVLGSNVTNVGKDIFGPNSGSDYSVKLQIENSEVNFSSDGLEMVKKIYMNQPGNINLFAFSNEVIVELCEANDSDGDSVFDCIDTYPNDSSKWFFNENVATNNLETLVDSDNDGLADAYDDFPYNYNEQHDIDSDGIGNNSDSDDDGDGLSDQQELILGTNSWLADTDLDGVNDGLDTFPTDNSETTDTDGDGVGNNADNDDDNDGYVDIVDAMPTNANEWADTDADGIGNNADTDDDNDGVEDAADAFPYTASESVDTDGDGTGDNADVFPNDPTEAFDTDLDGIGNNADPDDDNDGVADADDDDPLNPDVTTQPKQLIAVMGEPVGVTGYPTKVSVSYDVSTADNQLTGLGLRVHYDSSVLSYTSAIDKISEDIIVDAEGPIPDYEDFDNDPSTDHYISFGWAALLGNWPNVDLPTKLFTLQFDVQEIPSLEFANTPINFSKVASPEGYDFEATNYQLDILPATWDFDGNSEVDALTDGLILLRYAFGLRGDVLTNSAMAADATLTPVQLEQAIENGLMIADIDGNGEVNALTDGLLLLRYLFGLRDEALISDVIASDATRQTVEDVTGHIEAYMPNRVSDLNTAYSQTIIDFDDLNDPVSGYEYSNLGVIFSTESVGLITGHNGRITSGDWYQPLNIKFVNPDNNSLDATARNISIENPLEEDNMILYAYDLGGNLIETQSIQGAGIINFSEYGIHKIILDASETAFVMDNLSFLIE
jgi:hypothetical protein